eukprot:TRINITY_DN18453_c0_g1_i1.p1 TRINITY_DN18453_c0_g1~~TRINITY_DN18453_c0_g1_i1.p1  ORF type:complete len:311 (+),score=74.40 TRINITY_DN18453_c0_g1_i1:46-978(+)
MDAPPHVAEAFMRIEGIINGVPEGLDRKRLRELVGHLVEEIDEDAAEREAVVMDIKAFVKDLVPLSGEAGDEKVNLPEGGAFKTSTDENSMHLDLFLYDEDDVEDLVKAGKISTNFCKQCGSRDVDELLLHSHSLPIDAMEFIFEKVLTREEVCGKNFVDVGSRTGILLYYASLYYGKQFSRISGVEMSKFFCNVQRETVRNFSAALPSPIDIVEGDAFKEGLHLLQNANIAIFNNVFEFFLSKEDQIRAWATIKDTLKPNTIIIVVPSLENTLEELGMSTEWVTPVPLAYPEQSENLEVVESIHKYIVN